MLTSDREYGMGHGWGQFGLEMMHKCPTPWGADLLCTGGHETGVWWLGEEGAKDTKTNVVYG